MAGNEHALYLMIRRHKEVCPSEHLRAFGRGQATQFLQNTGFDGLFFLPVLPKSGKRVIARRMSETTTPGIETQ